VPAWFSLSISRIAILPDTVKTKRASLRVMQECLLAQGFAEEDAKRLIAPLRYAHDLRSKVKGHASGKDGAGLKKQILRDYGSYKAAFSFALREVRPVIEDYRRSIHKGKWPER
jgi:hypothetical protein